MSFNSGGHVVYLTEPKNTSQHHAITQANGSLLVFGAVPADGDPVEPEGVGTIVPEPLIGGRIVG